jgi:hypothetical protein
LIYVVPLVVLIVVILAYDTYDMRKVEGVGWLYLGSLGYWMVVLLRWVSQMGAASGMFRAGNFALSGNSDLTIPNVVGAISAAASIAILSVWREEVASLDPRLTSIFGFFQTLKAAVTASIAEGKRKRVEARALRDVDWLVARYGIRRLQGIYRRAHKDKYGVHANSDVVKRFRAWRRNCPDDLTYQRRLAEEIGRISHLSLMQKFLRWFGRGKLR